MEILGKSRVTLCLALGSLLSTPAVAGDPPLRPVATMQLALMAGPSGLPSSDVVLALALGGPGLLKRRDKAPPTIRPQLVSQDPAGDGELKNCALTSGRSASGSPRATQAECVVEITDTLALEYQDLQIGGKRPRSILLRITPPDGRARNLTATDALDSHDWLYLRPGDPLGPWEVVATAEGRTSSGGFTVKRPAKPSLLAAPEPPVRLVRAGNPVIVHFAGYRPSEEVNFYLYRLVGHRDRGTGESIFKFATTIGRTMADERGEGIISISTERDDPKEKYLVVTSPLQRSNLDAGTFEFER
jgi:hypothetical protein